MPASGTGYTDARLFRNPPVYTTLMLAASAGLLSTLHCLGMCGGIVAALALRPPAMQRRGLESVVLALGYNGGRIASYALLGVLGTALTLPAGGAPWAYRALQGLGLLALIFAGLRLGGWLNGAGWLERVGLRVWRRLSPLTRRVLPVDRLTRAIPAGLLWGFLPCGLVYAMLPVAAGTGSVARAAATMAAFGAGTLPGMLVASTLAQRLTGWRPARGLRRYAGAALIALAATWFGLQGLGQGHDHATHATHAQHAPATDPYAGHVLPDGGRTPPAAAPTPPASDSRSPAHDPLHQPAPREDDDGGVSR